MLRGATALTVSTALSLGLWAAPPAGAAPQAITCGESLTQSVTLDRNLSCPDVVFRIATAQPITVDLDGHTISSPATAYATVDGTGPA